MSDKPDISEKARALQRVNDELSKKYKPVPGLVEIGELVQCEMDAWLMEWQQANDMVGASIQELTERWPDVMNYVNGRPLRPEAIATLVTIAETYGIHQVVAIMDSFKIQNYSFDVIAEEPDLQINSRVTGL